MILLLYGVFLLFGGFRIIRKDKLGIEIIRVISIALVVYTLIILCFEVTPFKRNFNSMFPYLALAAFLFGYSNWKKLPYLYPNLSLSSYLWLVGILVGIIPFIFFLEELAS